MKYEKKIINYTCDDGQQVRERERERERENKHNHNLYITE